MLIPTIFKYIQHDCIIDRKMIQQNMLNKLSNINVHPLVKYRLDH